MGNILKLVPAGENLPAAEGKYASAELNGAQAAHLRNQDQTHMPMEVLRSQSAQAQAQA